MRNRSVLVFTTDMQFYDFKNSTLEGTTTILSRPVRWGKCYSHKNIEGDFWRIESENSCYHINNVGNDIYFYE